MSSFGTRMAEDILSFKEAMETYPGRCGHCGKPMTKYLSPKCVSITGHLRLGKAGAKANV